MKQIKTGGRIKGTPNKLTTDLKGTISDIINNQLSNLDIDLSSPKLSIKDKYDIIIKLLPYVIPKQTENTNLNLDNEIEVSDAEKEAVLNKFREMLREQKLQQSRQKQINGIITLITNKSVLELN